MGNTEARRGWNICFKVVFVLFSKAMLLFDHSIIDEAKLENAFSNEYQNNYFTYQMR